MKKIFMSIFMGIFLLVLPATAQVNILHHFAPSNVHGGSPYGDLISDGTYLYGMTSKLDQFKGGAYYEK